MKTELIELREFLKQNPATSRNIFKGSDITTSLIVDECHVIFQINHFHKTNGFKEIFYKFNFVEYDELLEILEDILFVLNSITPDELEINFSPEIRTEFLSNSHNAICSIQTDFLGYNLPGHYKKIIIKQTPHHILEFSNDQYNVGLVRELLIKEIERIKNWFETHKSKLIEFREKITYLKT